MESLQKSIEKVMQYFLVRGLRMDRNLPYVIKFGTRAMGIGFLRRNEAGRHQKYRVTARKEMKHVKASSEDEEPLNTSLFSMKAIFEEAEKEASLSLRMFLATVRWAEK